MLFWDSIDRTRKKLLRKLEPNGYVSMLVEYDGKDWSIVKTVPKNATEK